ncbi:MAG: hypothetical protein JWM48_2574 [Mycobacterium sp.]|nr:hypothetical protein [Mycobacterium sp.]
MRAASLAVLVAIPVVLSAAGCSSSSSDSRATTVDPPSSSASAGAPAGGSATHSSLTQAQAQAALLSVTDLPTGWTADTSSTSPDSGFSGCSALEAVGGHSKANRAKAEGSFTAGGVGPLLQEMVAVPSDETAAQAMTKLRSALNTCRSFTSTDADGKKTTFTTSALSFPKLGDETFAVQITAPNPLGQLVADVVVVRLGNTVVELAYAGLGATVNGAQLEELGRKAVQKAQSA